MSSSKVEFAGTRGNRLAGVMELPDQAAPRAFAVFAHCFACGKNSLAATKISRAVASRGIATLRFDFTGLGDSEGELGQAGITANVEDLVAAVHRMGATQGQPSLLVGHSLGGTAALLAARQLPQVKAVCTIGAPATAKHLLRQFKGAMVDAQGDWQVKLGGRDLSLSAEFIGELSNHASDAAASAGLGRALLVMHAPHDQVVGLEQAHALFSAASHPRSFVSLDDADHLLTRGADAGYVADVVSAWAGRYVDAAVQPPVPGPAELPGGSVWIGERDHAFWRTMRAGSHLLDADEPGELGGGDRGPGPYDLLLMSLGACTSMTLRVYAKRKGYSLHDVQAVLRHERLHAQDCTECDGRSGRVERITREITLQGPLSEEQRSDLLRVADLCPVHRTLEGQPVIVTRLNPER